MKPYNGIKKKTGFNIKDLSPVDTVTILYLVATTLYMLLGANSLENLFPHFAIRVAIIFFIGLLIWLNNNYENNFLHFVKTIYPLFFLSFFYAETSYMKNIIFQKNLDVYAVALEQMFWKCQPSIEFSKTMSQAWFSELMSLCYFSYYLITIVGLICIYFFNRKKINKSIFIVACSFYMYYLIYALFPIVGPQFYFKNLSTENETLYFFGKLMRNILENFEEPTGAFPSSHVGIAIIMSYISFKYLKAFFYISLPFVIGICFATVYLKAHYLIDVVAALVTVPVFVFFSKKMYLFLKNKLEKN